MNLSIVKVVCLLIISSLGLEVAASDDNVIPMFPRGKIEYQKHLTVGEHAFLLSTPKRISNALSIEKEQRIEGDRTNILFRIDKSSSSLEAFRFYQDYFSKHAKVLYQCEQRSCGSSNLWSNKIFEERKLYGRDSNQYYIVGTVHSGGKDYWLSVYSVTNGRKRHYVYISYVPASTQDSFSLVDWQAGREFEQAKLTSSEISSLTEYLEADPDISLWVIAFSGSSTNSSVSKLLEQSVQAAEQFRGYLVSTLGINAKRVQIKALGPFGQPAREQSDQVWFKLYLMYP